MVINIVFSHCLDEAQSERSKESIRSKCISYLDRAEKLKKFVADKDTKKPVKAGGSDGGGKYDLSLFIAAS